MKRLVHHAPLLAILLAIVAAFVAPRLRLSGDLSRLFPDDPASRALGSYVRSFGGGDVTTILVRGEDVDEVARASDEIAALAQGKPGIIHATTTLARAHDGDVADPTLGWAFADDATRAALAKALGDEGMRARLEETRALLLVPGGGAATAFLAHDPLRLLAIVAEAARLRSVAATVGADASGDLVADGGHARFVLVTTEGSALQSADARRIVEALEAAIGAVLPKHPGVRAGIAGGPAIARDAEKMIRSDLYLSSAISTLAVSLAFLVTFRRARALLAIGPPLIIGTLWTIAVAALFSDGIAAIAMGFASVVIGVGLDTGVHAYAAVLRIRSEEPELPRVELASRARAEVARPTLTAAFAAGLAFGSLALSRLPALRQLGLLCALGEVLTALAILALTPTIAARLEPKSTLTATPRVIVRLAELARARRSAGLIFTALGLGVVLLVVLGLPAPAPAIVAVKPRGLPALETQEEAIRLASGANAAISFTDHGGEIQLVITQRGRDETALFERGERLAQRLMREPSLVVEALSSWTPSPASIAARIAERDRLDLPARAEALSGILVEEGFSAEKCAPALEHLRHPATLETALSASDALRRDVLAPLYARHLARDPNGGELVLATYVRAKNLDAAWLQSLAREIDRDAVVTGYPVLERSLKEALAHDLPRVSLAALVLVALALRAVLRRFREVLVALIALAAELLLVALLVRLFAIPVHVYDALVLPVLIGITVDESMFLLHAARRGGPAAALRSEGRAIVATATTTAAGFAALLVCHFPGLRDLGAVGLVGTLAGLVASLLVVPAAAKLLGIGEEGKDAKPPEFERKG